eukprot:6184584-Pleurochrysis_carterae.AAC.1
MPLTSALVMLAAAPVVVSQQRGSFTHRLGYVNAGSNVLPPEATTLAKALARCNASLQCKCITYAGPDPEPVGVIPKVYYKGNTYFVDATDWHTWEKDFVPLSPTLNNPCLNASSKYASQPWCDATLPIDDRVKDAISRMTLEEKIGNLGTDAAAIPSLGLLKYNWWSESTHGARTSRGQGQYKSVRLLPLLHTAFFRHYVSSFKVRAGVIRAYSPPGCARYAVREECLTSFLLVVLALASAPLRIFE